MSHSGNRTAQTFPLPSCRDCGYTGRGLVASMIPGEYYCSSRRACERRREQDAAGANHGSWGTSPKWGRKRTAAKEGGVKYRTIVADPPWPLDHARIGKGGRRANETQVPYNFMSIEAIKRLGVRDIADDGCILFLWATRKLFREGIAVDVARAWGFEPRGELIWGLRNPGTGSARFANDHEPCLIATTAGSPWFRPDGDQAFGVWFWKQVYEYGPAGVPQKKHSAKPPGFYEFVEQRAKGPYLELFARRQRLGWDTWGNEALCHVDLGANV